MSRGLTLLIAVLGGAIIAYAAGLMLLGALAGFLWLFVFGDDPWPAWTAPVLGAVILLGGLTLWIAAARAIWLRFRPR